MDAIPVNTFAALACGAPAIAAAHALHNRLRWMRRWLIPPPIVAGLLLAVPTLLLRRWGVALEVDNTVQQVTMVALFTSIGFNLSGAAVRRGGRPAAIVLALFAMGALFQNVLGVALAKWQGVHPLFGIAAGAVAFAGGPATSLAFGPTLEESGARGATSVALASAITGILVAGVITGAFGGLLVQRYRLAPPKEPLPKERGEDEPVPAPAAGELLSTTVLFALAMGLGALLNATLQRGLGISLPAYVGAMIVAAGIRFAAARWPLLRMAPAWNQAVGTAALTWFIPLALWTLRYWYLKDLARPALVILLVQLPATLSLAWVVFRLVGRTFDSAVMAAGYFGFMYGTMANSLAAMNEMEDRFGRSRDAFLVISVSGGVVSDLANAIAIVLSRAAVMRWFS
jgi:ESS family glutamate:Na+ symporter